MENETLLKASLRHLPGALLSVPLGILGGMFCGAAILSLCLLSGRSQTTGAEYPGYLEHVGDFLLGVMTVGAMYGGIVGALMGPLGYVTVVRTTGFKRAILPATIGTIVGGYAGSLAAPLLGIPTGIAGFFIALQFVQYKYSVQLKGTAATAPSLTSSIDQAELR